MAPSSYLSLLLTISMIFISHAISPTPTPTPSPSPSPTPKLYESVCNEFAQKDQKEYQQPCLKLLEAYPQITSANDYLTFTKLYLKMVAIENATKAQLQVKEMYDKYPSSNVIKYCTRYYGVVVSELNGPLHNDDPGIIDMNVTYAEGAVNTCERLLAIERSVEISSISTLNNEMQFVIAIVRISSSHLNI